MNLKYNKNTRKICEEKIVEICQLDYFQSNIRRDIFRLFRLHLLTSRETKSVLNVVERIEFLAAAAVKLNISRV